MGKQKRSPKEPNRNSQESEPQGKQNGWIEDPNSKLYLPKDYLSEQDKKPPWLLKPRIGGKTFWDWLSSLGVPALIAIIAGIFTLITVSQQNKISRQQNEIFKQRDEAEEDRNQQALLIKYLDDISELVEKQLLTLDDDENSKTQRIIARARTLSVLRALDRDRKGELIQFLATAQLVEADEPIIGLWGVDLRRANLMKADLWAVNLWQANLEKADLRGSSLFGADLEGADLRQAKLEEAELVRVDLEGADLRQAKLEEANLEEANLSYVDLSKANLNKANLERANLEGASFIESSDLDTAQIKSACNWQEADFDKKLREKLSQEPDRKVGCAKWNWDL